MIKFRSYFQIQIHFTGELKKRPILNLFLCDTRREIEWIQALNHDCLYYRTSHRKCSI